MVGLNHTSQGLPRQRCKVGVDHREGIDNKGVALGVQAIRHRTGEFGFWGDLHAAIQEQLVEVVVGHRAHVLRVVGPVVGAESHTINLVPVKGAKVSERKKLVVQSVIQAQVQGIGFGVGRVG